MEHFLNGAALLFTDPIALTIFAGGLLGGMLFGCIPGINMLTLCKYIDTHTVDAIHKPTAEKIEILVNINRNIAGGLLDGLKKAVEDAEGAEAGAQPAAAPEPAAAQTAAPVFSIDETI